MSLVGTLALIAIVGLCAAILLMQQYDIREEERDERDGWTL